MDPQPQRRPLFLLSGSFNGLDNICGETWIKRFEYEHQTFLQSGESIPADTYLKTAEMLMTEDAAVWIRAIPQVSALFAKPLPTDADVATFRALFIIEFPPRFKETDAIGRGHVAELEAFRQDHVESNFCYYQRALSLLRRMGGRDRPSPIGPPPFAKGCTVLEMMFLHSVTKAFAQGIFIEAVRRNIEPAKDESLFSIYNRTENAYLEYLRGLVAQQESAASSLNPSPGSVRKGKMATNGNFRKHSGQQWGRGGRKGMITLVALRFQDVDSYYRIAARQVHPRRPFDGAEANTVVEQWKRVKRTKTAILFLSYWKFLLRDVLNIGFFSRNRLNFWCFQCYFPLSLCPLILRPQSLGD